MRFVDFKNLGIVSDTVPNDIMLELQLEIDEIQTNFSNAQPHNKSLVGNIIHEYTLNKSRSSLEKYVIDLAQAHDNQYKCIEVLGARSILGSHMRDRAAQLRMHLSTLWVNFQRKGEFNPIHTHNGIYSFVIWVKIPYFMEIEKACGPGRKSMNNKAGSFEFIYQNILGDTVGEIIEADKKMEGTIVLFPARLNHTVYPFFSSDDFRISVSGNLYLDE